MTQPKLLTIARKYLTRRTVLPLLLLILALSLRLYDLGSGAVWFDEAVEIITASTSLDDLPAMVRDLHFDPPLYSILLHYWLKLGISPTFVRLLSVIFSMAGIFGAMCVAARLGGRRASLLAGFLMAVAAVEIRYAQDASQYSLMIGLVLWTNWALLDIAKNAYYWRKYALWTFLAIIATYAYYGAAFAILVPFGVEALRNIFQQDWKRLIASSVSVFSYFAGLIPLFAFYIPAQFARSPAQGLEQLSISSVANEFKITGSIITHTISFMFTGWPYTHIPEWIPIVLLGFVILMAFYKSGKPSHYEKSWNTWLVTTATVYILLVRVGLYPHGFRHSLFLLALLIPMMGSSLRESISNHKIRWLGYTILTVYAILSAVSLPNRSIRNLIYPDAQWSWPETNYDFEPSFQYWRENHQANEPIYIYYGGNFIFRYYLRLYGIEERNTPSGWYHSCGRDWNGPPCSIEGVIYGNWIRGLPKEKLVVSVKNSLPPETHAFWIMFVSVQNQEDQMILDGLQSEYTITDAFEIKGSPVYYLTQKNDL